jgi:2-keto-4-pentenoate hydratase/2-oxohepta-3-ene-1,7-dioic acid hydratase in catechol pathway
MRLARIHTDAGPVQVVQRGDRWEAIGDMFAAELEYTGESFPVGAVQFLSPVEPRVVVGMAHNGGPGDREQPPQAFLKSARTVVGVGSDIVADAGTGRLHIEGELGLVLGRAARHLAPGAFAGHVLGYTIGNDVTSVTQIGLDDKLLQAKNGDGYTPLGPWIETDIDPSALVITVLVNGAVVAQSSTAQLAWSIDEQLVYLSSHLELGPGDVLLTGAPGTFAPAETGDDVEIRIDGIGSLCNRVSSGRARAALPTP